MIIDRTKPREHKIKNSMGVMDVYRYIRKNKWMSGTPIDQRLFCKVIKEVNLKIADALSNGETINLPCRMGTLELRKYDASPRFHNGVLKIKYPIDWKATIDLWESDESCHRDKVFIRRQSRHIFFINYDKYRANFKNQAWYKFRLNRSVKVRLANNINNNKIDAYIIN